MPWSATISLVFMETFPVLIFVNHPTNPRVWTRTWSSSPHNVLPGLSFLLRCRSTPLALVVGANVSAGLQQCSAVYCEVGACLRGSAFCSYSLAWPGACCCCTTLWRSHGTRAAPNCASRSWSWASATSKLSAQRTNISQGHITRQWLDTVRLWSSLTCVLTGIWVALDKNTCQIRVDPRKNDVSGFFINALSAESTVLEFRSFITAA